MSLIWFYLLGVLLLFAFIMLFRKTALFVIIVGGLIFVAYKIGFFGLILKKIFGFG